MAMSAGLKKIIAEALDEALAAAEAWGECQGGSNGTCGNEDCTREQDAQNAAAHLRRLLGLPTRSDEDGRQPGEDWMDAVMKAVRQREDIADAIDEATPPEWDEYTHGRDEPVPCPPDCTNHDMGRCPRCFANTGLGCPHGALCEECLDDDPTDPTYAAQSWCPTCGRLEKGPGRCDHCGRVGAVNTPPTTKERSR